MPSNDEKHRNDLQMRLNRRRLVGGAAAVAGTAGLGAAGLATLAQESTPGGDPGGASASPAASPQASPAGGEGPVVHAVDIAFEPNAITIPANTDVTVTIENHGNLQHDFAVEDLDVLSELLGAGESTTVTINAEPGEYEFYCTVAGHREAGMVGTLTVE